MLKTCPICSTKLKVIKIVGGENRSCPNLSCNLNNDFPAFMTNFNFSFSEKEIFHLYTPIQLNKKIYSFQSSKEIVNPLTIITYIELTLLDDVYGVNEYIIANLNTFTPIQPDLTNFAKQQIKRYLNLMPFS